MSFCLTIKVREGLVGLADTRVTVGAEVITARKVYTFQRDHQSLFIMTSGLRSLRDKVLTYFDELLTDPNQSFDRMFRAVNAFGAQVRRVAHEDQKALEQNGLQFNMHALVAGQFQHDAEHKLYLVYPAGNWVEINDGTPYQIIGSTGYGKPVLDRTLNYEDSMRFAFKVACLAFDSTRISAADVDFPIDVVLLMRNSFRVIEHRYEKADLQEVSNWWQERLRSSVNELPSEWIEHAFSKLMPQTDKVTEFPKTAS
jgi:putative proteasome-type protease